MELWWAVSRRKEADGAMEVDKKEEEEEEKVKDIPFFFKW